MDIENQVIVTREKLKCGQKKIVEEKLKKRKRKIKTGVGPMINYTVLKTLCHHSVYLKFLFVNYKMFSQHNWS